MTANKCARLWELDQCFPNSRWETSFWLDSQIEKWFKAHRNFMCELSKFLIVKNRKRSKFEMKMMMIIGSWSVRYGR